MAVVVISVVGVSWCVGQCVGVDVVVGVCEVGVYVWKGSISGWGRVCWGMTGRGRPEFEGREVQDKTVLDVAG